MQSIFLESTTPVPEDEEAPSVDALPTFDGNVIINWTPSKTPVDQYILQWTPQDGSSPSQNVTKKITVYSLVFMF